MAIGPLPPVINEIQANSGQPGKTLAQQTAAGSLLDLQAAATAEPATAILPETTLIERAVAEALGRQGGLAPLYATLAGLADAPELPDAVKAAINTVLAFRLGDGDVTPERVAEAIRSSGVFHEAVAAGKMAAALSPAVRQALGGAPEDRRQGTARPAMSTAAPATTPAAARQAPAVPASAPSTAGAPASAAQAYGRQGGLPASTAAPVAPQVSSAGSAAGGPSIMPGAPAAPVAVPPTTGPAAPSATAAAAPAPSTATGEPSPTAAAAPAVPASPLPPTVQVARDASAPLSPQVPSTGAAEAQPAPSIAGGAAPSSSSPPVSPAAPSPSAVAGQFAGPPTPVPGSVLPSASSPSPASDPPDAQAPAQPSLAASPAPSASASASSRSFAPWTPGRPLTPAAPLAASTPPAGSSADAGRPASPPSVIVSDGGETPVPRLTGDRAPFVPSDVESLPRAVPGPAAPRTAAAPAATSVMPSAPAQPGAAPSAAAPAASPQPVASQQVAGQGLSQVEQQPAPQVLPAAPAIAETSAPPVRQPTLPTAATPPMPGVDLKGALEVLRRELITWLGRNADVMASLDGAGDDAAAPRVDRPPPPRKGGPVRGQPAMPLLGEDGSETVSTETLAGRALGEAERSLSRVFLHQAATAEIRDAKAAQPTPALMLEIPIAGPNGTSVAQLRIERDDHAPSEPGGPPRRVFQVDIAFDIAPLGPVAVRVGLMDGRRVAVGVWCDSDDGLVRMEAERENIVLGLEQEGMVVAGVDLHRGHPPEGRDETAAAASHRLDLQL